jgi:hypothetical protein
MNAPDGIGLRLSEIIDQFADGIDVLRGAQAISELVEDGTDGQDCDSALIALHENIVDRFQRALGMLKAVAHDIDPASVAERPTISAGDEQWLRRALDGLGR